jgi:hypothetical protein
MPSTIADFLDKARRDSFIGREKEVALFEAMLDHDSPPYFLLYLHGTAGQGKSSLFKRFREICNGRSCLNYNINGRDIQPRPTDFIQNLQSQLPPHDTQNTFDVLAKYPQPTVLFIDSYERLSPIDEWLRREFLPQLPDHVRTVIASRKPPSGGFLTDPGWQALMRISLLRNFNPTESRTLLNRRNIPEKKFGTILDFTHGHPLALSVVADIYEQRPDQEFKPDESPDVLRTLLEHFIQEVPSPYHRMALEICALAHLTTESLISEILGLEQADVYFEWLRGLSFVESGKFGLYPHDLAREAIVADLRWRNPDRFADLHEKAGGYFKRRLREFTGEMQRAMLFELVFLHRTNPVVRPFFDWQESTHWMDFMVPDDMPVLRDLVEQFEGQESARIFSFWAKHPAAEVWVWRDGLKRPGAFVLRIDAHKLDVGERISDEAFNRILDYRHKQLHLRSGEQFSVFRMWMAQETYQGVSNLQSSMFLAIVQYYFTPGLAAHLIITAHPAFWEAVFNYADLHHVPELDFTVNDIPFGFFQHDWRLRPPVTWLELLGKREIDASAGMTAPLEAPKLQLVVLSEAEFEQSVGEALKGFYSGQDLDKNPLLSSRLIVKETGLEASEAERVDVLKNKIGTTLKAIEQSPLEGKFHRVLYRTFINPVGSQEKTAEFLHMSFSTYRRYLKAGMERVVERLWREEIE